jgi:hypothetical protein
MHEALAEVTDIPVSEKFTNTAAGYIRSIMIETGMLEDEVYALVQDKKDQLKGLVSTEGALFIICKELGITIIKDVVNELKDVESGWKDVESGWKDVVKKAVVEKEDWKSFLGSLPRDEGGSKKTPSLVLKDNITYLLKINTKIEPYHHHEDAATNTYGKDYDSWKFVVTLIKVKDEDSYDDVFQKGDLKGQPLYVDGQEYALWFTHDKDKWSPMDGFAQFWTDTLGLSDFDDRVFGVKKFKKMSKNGRQYSAFKFFEVK